MSIWHQEHHNISNFANISKQEQDRIVGLMCDKNAVKDYWFELSLERIMPHLSDSQQLKIALNIIQSGEKRGRTSALYNCIKKSFDINPDVIKNAINSSPESSITKILLILNPNKDEEIKGLRALSTNKHTPDIIYENKYEPSIQAIKDLPPVMRLNVLETLANSRYVNYNIFSNINENNFEDLLFPNIIKYPQRVSDIMDRFREIRYRGTDSKISVEGECDRCGPYEFVLKSKSFRTETGLKSTNTGRILLGNHCPFCYRNLKKAALFKDLN